MYPQKSFCLGSNSYRIAPFTLALQSVPFPNSSRLTRQVGTTTLLATLLLLLVTSIPARAATPGVTEINLPLRGLAYDRFTQKLYGTSSVTNNLLQIDPVTGTVLRAFDIGAKPSRVEVSAGRGLWIGLDDEGAVRRFNLETFTAEDKIVVSAGLDILDIAPSPGDPQTLAVAVSAPDPQAFLIRNAQVLPNSVSMSYVTFSGNSVYGQRGVAMIRADIIANGLTPAFQSIGTQAGDAEVDGEIVYKNDGYLFWTQNMQFSGVLPSTQVLMGDVTINREADEIFYLGTSPTWALLRFDKSSRLQTGEARFGQGKDGGYVDLQAWGTNSAAFHSTTTLYLVQLDQLFQPAELDIIQTVEGDSSPYGTNFTITVTVTNKGPGTAVQMSVTNFLESLPGGAPANIRWPIDQALFDPSSVAPFKAPLNSVLGPGLATVYTVGFMPGRPGIFTNRVAVSSYNEPNPQDNLDIFTLPITKPTNGLVRLSFQPTDIESSPADGKVWFSYAGNIWWLTPTEPQLSILPPTTRGAGKIAAAPQGNFLYVETFDDGHGHGGFIARLPDRTDTGPFTAFTRVHDMAVSPADPDLYAVSHNSVTYLARGWETLPNTVNGVGYLGFSSDGAKLYRTTSDTCDVSIYNVTATGLVFERTWPGAGCGEFNPANGYLYFENGLIFDPATGARVPNTPVITPPAFLLPAANRGFDVLKRTNNLWTITRWRPEGTNYVSFAERAFPDLVDPVTEIASAGHNHMIVRTAADLIVLDLPSDPNSFEPTISHSPAQTTIRFSSVAGATYRIESTPQLQPAQWTTAHDNIPGTGSIITQTIPTPDRATFYRIVKLP